MLLFLAFLAIFLPLGLVWAILSWQSRRPPS